MDRDLSPPPPTRTRALLCAADQTTVAILVGTCFLAIVLHGCWQAIFRQQRIEFDQAPVLQIDFQIDVNAADWPEFTLLPGIGETLARRIVSHRATARTVPLGRPTRDVKGIGPKTLRRIRPFVRVEKPEAGGAVIQRRSDGS